MVPEKPLVITLASACDEPELNVFQIFVGFVSLQLQQDDFPDVARASGNRRKLENKDLFARFCVTAKSTKLDHVLSRHVAYTGTLKKK